MTSFWDAALGNVTILMKSRGMWDDTVLVLTTVTITIKIFS